MLASGQTEKSALNVCDLRTNFWAKGNTCPYAATKFSSGERQHLAVRYTVLSGSYLNEQVLQSILELESATYKSYLIDVLKYYQSMLLDGQVQHLSATGYSMLATGFRPLPLYSSAGVTQHARDLKSDLAVLRAAKTDDDVQAWWQMVLTDMELNMQRQFVDYVAKGSVDLGVAGKDAAKIFDAMIACQIQASCYLEPHQAEQLGFHNFYDAE